MAVFEVGAWNSIKNILASDRVRVYSMKHAIDEISVLIKGPSLEAKYFIDGVEVQYGDFKQQMPNCVLKVASSTSEDGDVFESVIVVDNLMLLSDALHKLGKGKNFILFYVNNEQISWVTFVNLLNLKRGNVHL